MQGCAAGNLFRLGAGRRLPLPARARTLASLRESMDYQEQSRRLSILGGFALGIAFGAGVGLLMGPRRPSTGSPAVERARKLRAPRGGRVHQHAGGAAGRMARKKFAL